MFQTLQFLQQGQFDDFLVVCIAKSSYTVVPIPTNNK